MNLAGDHRPLILARPLEAGGECTQLLVGALHFLLGEAAHLSADTDTAQIYFSRLQSEYFPDQTYLPSLLLAVDVRRLINLHA